MSEELESLQSLHERMSALEQQIDGIGSAVSIGVVHGIKTLAKDEEFAEAFWKNGFDQISAHATSAGSQWVGRRILTAFIISITTAGIVWLVRTGAIK